MKKSLSLLLALVLLLALAATAYAADPAKKVETKSGVTVMHAADWKEQFPDQYETWLQNNISAPCMRATALPSTMAPPAATSTMSRTSRLPDGRTRWPTAGHARHPTLPTW